MVEGEEVVVGEVFPITLDPFLFNPELDGLLVVLEVEVVCLSDVADPLAGWRLVKRLEPFRVFSLPASKESFLFFLRLSSSPNSVPPGSPSFDSEKVLLVPA